MGINLNSDLAYFCLHTTEMSFKWRIGSIDNICWYLIYSTYAQRIESLQCFLGLSKEYIPLDSFETEGGFFYNRETEEVLELELGQKLIDFQNGKLQPQWKSFNSSWNGFSNYEAFSMAYLGFSKHLWLLSSDIRKNLKKNVCQYYIKTRS